MSLILRYCPVFFLALLAQPSAVHGQLTYETLQVKKEAKPEDAQSEIIIPFKNTGSKAITISKVESSCGCISAQANRGESNAVYAAGDEGFVKATFTLGTMEGELTKSLYVHSDDPEEPRRHIQISISIPKLMSITPEVTTWKIGEEPTAKTVKIKMLGKEPIEVTAVSSSRTAVTAEFKEIEKGREYDITIKPEATTEPILGALRITTNSPVTRYQNKMCFFNIVRAPRNQSASPPETATPAK